MKSSTVYKQRKALALSIASLTLLPGCNPVEWFKDMMGNKASSKQIDTSLDSSSREVSGTTSSIYAEADGSKVLATMDGKPIVTLKRLESEKSDLLEANPQLKSILVAMGEEQIDRNIVEGLVSQAVVTRYIQENGIDQTEEYKQEERRILNSVRNMLNTSFFTKKFATTVSDSEAREFYEKNKDVIPQLIISRGGIRASCVSFDTQEEADAFLAKAQAGDLKTAAEEQNLSSKFKELNLVHSQSLGIDPTLREKITTVSTFPTSAICATSDGKFIVYQATEKEETKYRPFEQIRDEIKRKLEGQKASEAFEKEVTRLKQEYGIQYDTEFFKEEQSMTPEDIGNMPEFPVEEAL